MRFHKYHGLGNDYLVLDPAEVAAEPTAEQVRRICDRHFGVGSDGILWGPIPSAGGRLGVRIFNPDGNQAEKSGNGLRIFSRYLRDADRVGDESFEIVTRGGVVRSRVREGGKSVTVEMGKVSFHSRDVPVAGPPREVLNEEIAVLDRKFRFCAAGIGNPHCVVMDAPVSDQTARTYGPAMETNGRFPNRTNVQFLEVLDRHSIRIEIWERGAGYTLASGSSGCAAAAVACRLGLCGRDITVHMPGGRLLVSLGEDFAATLTGPVVKVCAGVIAEEMLMGYPAP